MTNQKQVKDTYSENEETLWNENELEINNEQYNTMMIEQYNCLHEEFKHPKCFNATFINQQYSLLHLTLSLL